jgi:hypothetical protein
MLDGATKELVDRGVQAESVLAMGDAADAILELANSASGSDRRGRGPFFEPCWPGVGNRPAPPHCDVLIVH